MSFQAYKSSYVQCVDEERMVTSGGYGKCPLKLVERFVICSLLVLLGVSSPMSIGFQVRSCVSCACLEYKRYELTGINSVDTY